MIKFTDVGLSFVAGHNTLSNINLEIVRGEFVYVIGKSGAGKSSFLRLIYADVTPTRGVVSIEGKDISVLGREQIPYLRRQIGVIFQDYKILEGYTVFDNVKFALDIFYMKRSSSRQLIYPLLKRLGIFEKRDDIVRNLSGGEKQRVAVARALINEPKIILADEPTGNLDIDNATNIMNILNEAKNAGTTIVMATHDHLLRSRFRARQIELDNGRVVQDGSDGVDDGR